MKDALRGTIIIFIFSLLSGFFGYLMRIVLARNLTVEEFGLFYSVLTVFYFISYFLDSGMSQSISKYIIELNIKKKNSIINDLLFSVFYIQMFFGILISILLIVFSDFLSKNYFHAETSTLILLFSVWLLAGICITIYNSVFIGFKKFYLFSIFDMLKSFFSLLLVFLFFKMKLGNNSTSPALAYAVSSSIIIILSYYFVKRLYKNFSFTKFSFDSKRSKDAFKFGIYIALSNLAWFLITQTDTLMLTYFTDSVQVALYQVAVPISAILLYLTSALSVVIFPMTAELKSKNDSTQIISGLKSIYTYLIMILLPAVIMIFAFPDIIINILFTSKYLGAINVLKILAVSSLFLSLAMINNSVLTALGKPKKVARTMFTIALLNFLLNIFLIPKFGIVGAASSTIISFIIASIISSIYIKNEINIQYPFVKWISLGAISVIVIFVVNILRNIVMLSLWPKLIVIGSIVILIYFLLLLLFGILNLGEAKSLIVGILYKEGVPKEGSKKSNFIIKKSSNSRITKATNSRKNNFKK